MNQNVIAKPITHISNRTITVQQILSHIGHGIVIILPKPGKPVGAMASLKGAFHGTCFDT